MKLNQIGKIVENCLINIPSYAEFCEIDTFIVMPNHLHAIIVINDRIVGGDPLVAPMGQTGRFVPTVKRKSVSEIIKNFKTYSSKIIHEKFKSVSFSWQRSFWDHVIRHEFVLSRIRKYILNNPLKWEYDKNNLESRMPMKRRGAW